MRSSLATHAARPVSAATLPAVRSIGVLLAYGRYFRRLVFMSPNPAVMRQVSKLRHASVLGHHCASWIKATYTCVAAVAAAHGGGLRGVVYLHFDLWLQPWALHQMPLDMAWSLPPHRIMPARSARAGAHLQPPHLYVPLCMPFCNRAGCPHIVAMPEAASQRLAAGVASAGAALTASTMRPWRRS